MKVKEISKSIKPRNDQENGLSDNDDNDYGTGALNRIPGHFFGTNFTTVTNAADAANADAADVVQEPN